MKNTCNVFSLEMCGTIATIRICRAAAANAIPTSAWRELRATIDAAIANGARALILRSGNPRVVSAGADIGDLAQLTDDVAERVRFRSEMREALNELGSLPAVALVEGGCYGASVAIAMACDVRYAKPCAEFAITPARLGISYPQEDVTRLVDLIGKGQAARLLLSGEVIDAVEAARIGLVEAISEDAAACAESWANSVSGNSSTSVSELRRALDGQSTADAFDAAFGGPNFRKGLIAFRTRRR